MQFEKYFYGDREVVVFVDETGDPSLRDPQNPVFAFGACAALGADLDNSLRLPWREIRRKVTGSADRALHMRTMGRRLDASKIELINQFLDSSSIRRVSVAVTDRTVFDDNGLPKSPVMELCLQLTLDTVADLMRGSEPIETISLVFEDSNLIERIRPHWQALQLVRNDGIKISVNWAALSKEADEPGLDIADFIAHSTAGFIREKRSEDSKFAKRYRAIFPIASPAIAKGLEINAAERKPNL